MKPGLEGLLKKSSRLAGATDNAIPRLLGEWRCQCVAIGTAYDTLTTKIKHKARLIFVVSGTRGTFNMTARQEFFNRPQGHEVKPGALNA